jgi:uncharacterized protein HemY
MNEQLRAAERHLAMGLVDQAERLFGQALERDPRSAIATLGLARVAGERGDDRAAFDLARRAVELDPGNAAAVALTVRLREVLAGRGEAVELPPSLRDRRAGLLDRLFRRRGG